MDETAEADEIALPSFGTGVNAAVIGASGGIGRAFAEALERMPGVDAVARLSRSKPAAASSRAPWTRIDLEDEASVERAARALADDLGALHLVIVAAGVLHDDDGLRPEKTWRHLAPEPMARAFRINATGPALVAKHFLPLLARGRKSVFAALSARVGSIGDNRLGGWHAYRASKAALNMILRTLAIELARRNPAAICVGLHPGTVDTKLSEPFQANVPDEQLFTPDRSARCLLRVIEGLDTADSGQVFAWDGQPVPP